MSSESMNRLHQIDALRGLAALLVLITHTGESLAPYATKYGHSDVLAQWTRGIDTGRIGVMIFFIISGFVVAHTLSRSANSLAKFAIRRICRLFPLYWFSIVLVMFFHGGGSYLLSPNVDHPTLLANFTMLPTLFGFHPMMIVYWTLETELVFYFVAVLVYRMDGLFNAQKLFLLIVALIAIFAAIMFGLLPSPSLLSWKSLALNLAFMFWGALFYAVVSNRKEDGQKSNGIYLLLISTVIILAPSFYTFMRFFSSQSPDDFRWAVAYPAAVMAFVLVFFANGKRMRWVSGLGVISYSMYLLHPIVIAMVAAFLEVISINFGVASLPILTGVTIGIAIVISIMSYFLLEKPLIFLGKKMTTKAA